MGGGLGLVSVLYSATVQNHGGFATVACFTNQCNAGIHRFLRWTLAKHGVSACFGVSVP